MSEQRGSGFCGVAAIIVAVGFSIFSTASAEPRLWASKVPADQAKATSPLPANADSLAAGKDVYTNTCLPCHGPAAQGDGPAAQFIKPKPKPLVLGNKLSLPDGVAFWVVTNGIDNTGMASFSDQLSETERWQAIYFLHSLAGDAGAASASASNPLPAASPAASPIAVSSPAPKAATSTVPVSSPVQKASPSPAAAAPK